MGAPGLQRHGRDARPPAAERGDAQQEDDGDAGEEAQHSCRRVCGRITAIRRRLRLHLVLRRIARSGGQGNSVFHGFPVGEPPTAGRQGRLRPAPSCHVIPWSRAMPRHQAAATDSQASAHDRKTSAQRATVDPSGMLRHDTSQARQASAHSRHSSRCRVEPRARRSTVAVHRAAQSSSTCRCGALASAPPLSAPCATLTRHWRRQVLQASAQSRIACVMSCCITALRATVVRGPGGIPRVRSSLSMGPSEWGMCDAARTRQRLHRCTGALYAASRNVHPARETAIDTLVPILQLGMRRGPPGSAADPPIPQ